MGFDRGAGPPPFTAIAVIHLPRFAEEADMSNGEDDI